MIEWLLGLLSIFLMSFILIRVSCTSKNEKYKQIFRLQDIPPPIGTMMAEEDDYFFLKSPSSDDEDEPKSLKYRGHRYKRDHRRN